MEKKEVSLRVGERERELSWKIIIKKNEMAVKTEKKVRTDSRGRGRQAIEERKRKCRQSSTQYRRAQIESDWIPTQTHVRKSERNRTTLKLKYEQRQTNRNGTHWKESKQAKDSEIYKQTNRKQQPRRSRRRRREANKLRIFMWIFPFQITSI